MRFEPGEHGPQSHQNYGPGMRPTPIGHFDIPPPPEWVDQALCAQVDPERWFPEKGGSTREAKRICGMCPVQAACLEDALTRRERFGIWGGYSERERRALER